MRQIFKNILKLWKNPISLIGFFIWVIIIIAPGLYFLEPELIINNIWYNRLYLEYGLMIIIWFLFGIFVSATLYKIQYFSGSKKDGILGSIGWFFGVLVVGCPSCSITLASYIGLAGIVSLLPYDGLELKILSVFLLIYACYSTLKNLEVCQLKKKK